jgi:hypothetical protein
LQQDVAAADVNLARFVEKWDWRYFSIERTEINKQFWRTDQSVSSLI